MCLMSLLVTNLEMFLGLAFDPSIASLRFVDSVVVKFVFVQALLWIRESATTGTLISTCVLMPAGL
jgi:hypothetical protein